MQANKWIGVTLLMGMVSVWAHAANASDLTGTMKKIRSTGKIVLGVRDSPVPFSVPDDKQTYQGYAIGICLKVVTSIKQQLGIADCAIRIITNTDKTKEIYVN